MGIIYGLRALRSVIHSEAFTKRSALLQPSVVAPGRVLIDTVVEQVIVEHIPEKVIAWNLKAAPRCLDKGSPSFRSQLPQARDREED